MKEFKLEELEAATENFSQSRLIGKGSHGHVYRGILQEDHQFVAVKKQSLGLQKLQDNSKLENEVHILSSLQSDEKNNLYLINLVGISHDSSKNKVLIMEYMPNGTLHEMLHLASTPPTWPKRVEIAIQIAKALEFLHESNPSIIHRDIKSTNILFDSDWNARLADFGLAIRMNSDLITRPAGTIGYLDPSYTVPSKLSTKIDVFSFGVLLLEMISGRKAIDVSRSPSSLVEWAIPLIERHRTSEIYDQRVHLSRFMEGTIRNMLTIASRSVFPREENRPSMKQIVLELENCIILEPVVRIPVWMNLLQSLILLKRQVRIGAKKDNSSTSATDSISCETHQENDHVNINIPRGKLLLREILAVDQ